MIPILAWFLMTLPKEETSRQLPFDKLPPKKKPARANVKLTFLSFSLANHLGRMTYPWSRNPAWKLLWSSVRQRGSLSSDRIRIRSNSVPVDSERTPHALGVRWLRCHTSPSYIRSYHRWPSKIGLPHCPTASRSLFAIRAGRQKLFGNSRSFGTTCGGAEICVSKNSAKKREVFLCWWTTVDSMWSNVNKGVASVDHESKMIAIKKQPSDF